VVSTAIMKEVQFMRLADRGDIWIN